MGLFKDALAFLFELQIQGVTIAAMDAIFALIVVIGTKVAPEAVFIGDLFVAGAVENVMLLEVVGVAGDIADFFGLHDGFFHCGCSFLGAAPKGGGSIRFIFQIL